MVKGKATRKDLSKPALGRLLRKGAAKTLKDVSISGKAYAKTREMVTDLLQDLAEKCENKIGDGKKKTITLNVLKKVVKEYPCGYIGKSDLVYEQVEKRDLTREGTERIFRKALSDGVLVADGVKIAILAIANNFVIRIGLNASLYMSAAHHKTIMGRDIVKVSTQLSLVPRN